MEVSEEVHKAYERQRSYEHRQKHKEYSHVACSVDELAGISDSTNIEEEVEKRELLGRVYTIINTILSDEERAVIYGSFFGGQTANELAKRLGITAESVRQKKVRALRKIRDMLGREFD